MKKKLGIISYKHSLPRERRLATGKEWLTRYEGKHPVRGYAKRFRVDLLCAIVELRLLGVSITEEYETAVKRTISERAAHKQQKKSQGISPLRWGIDQNDDFAYIAGYTPGGAPFGIRWDELSEEERQQYSDI